MVITGYAGMLLPPERIILTSRCQECGSERYSFKSPGVEVNPSTWDGTDFFRAWPLPNFIFLSDRAAKALLRNHFSGFSLTCPEHFESEGMGPGSLRDLFGEDEHQQ